MDPAGREYPSGKVIPGTIYKVISLIGQGGMGTVYEVEDTTVDKLYVLKTLHAHLGAREDLARRIQKEARILGRLRHANIIEVITAGMTGDDLRLPYYVMERLEGQSLRTILTKKGQLDPMRAVRITIDLLDALEFAHQKGVIHRDVKPDNIFLQKTLANVTVTKLLDFGIVSLLDASARETAGRFLGTLQYAAPEQLQGKAPTARMDVYCAGLVLYEMLAGRGPFDDLRDPMAIAHAHIGQMAPLVSTFVLGLPRDLERLIAAVLAKDPLARPRDAASFAASLRNLKRLLGPDSIADPITALAMDPLPASAPVDVQQPNPGGQYVVSPMLAPAPIPQPAPEPTPGPRTTVRVVPAPTAGRPASKPEMLVATSHEAAGVDREAPTGTLAPQGTPQQPVAETLPWIQPSPGDPAPTPPRSPEPYVARSEEAQVRTLLASEGQTSHRAPVVMVVVGGLGLCTLLAALLVVRHEVALHATAPAPLAVPQGATAEPPLPQPVVTMPAPTIAVPSLEDPVASAQPEGSTSAAKPLAPRPRPSATTKPSTPIASPAPSPVPPPAPPPVASPPPPAPADRPGPGF